MLKEKYDLTGELSLEVLLKGQSEVLQLITRGESLTIVLDRLVTWVEELSGEGLIPSILAVDESGQHLYHLASTQLPTDYIEAINGLKIGPKVGSCGTAAYLKKPVIVENIEESELWKDFKEYALKHNLRSCWSTPLINNEGRLRGTFAIYYRSPRRPTQRDKQLVSLFAHTALIAIENDRAKQEQRKAAEKNLQMIENLRKSDERFQNLVREARVGIIVLMGEGMVVSVVNEMYGKLIDRTSAQLLNKPLFSIIPEAEKMFRPILERVLHTGEPIHLYDQPYHVMAGGREINGYLNIVYQPYREMDGSISGVMALCHDVTEVVLSRKKLEQSEEQFRNLVMKAPVAIGVFKGRGLVAEIVNDNYLRLVDRTRNDIENRPLLEAIPEMKELVETFANEFFASGKPITFTEYPVQLVRSGEPELCYFNAVWEPLFDSKGEVEGFITVAQEITQLVQARRVAEESEQQIRSFVESAPFPIGVYTGREMRIQFANQAIKDVWGKGKGVEGKLYAEVLPELANQGIYEQLDRVYTTGIAFHAKRQRIDLLVDGVLRPFYFNYSFTPLYNTKGNVYGVMNTAAEVTELMTAYKELEESEARSRLATEASDLGTFDIDLRTNKLKASKRLTEIFDVDDDAEWHHLISSLQSDDLEIRENAYKTAHQTGILDYERAVIKKNGDTIWIRVKGKIYFDKDNKPERQVGIVQDITERRKYTETLAQKVQERTKDLEQANMQLHRINEELQQFAYISSHDLQEPLRKIRVFSDMLSNNLEKNGKEYIHIQKIQASAERMSGLIQSLLEYTRTANAALRFEKVDLNTLFKSVLTDYELLIGQKEAIIELDNLPTIDAVPLQMNQLFFNLLGNALKFTKRGVSPVIKITAEPLPEHVRQQFSDLAGSGAYTMITVKDNGIGFEQGFASQIFTVFQRLNDRSSYGGYGIGLALCKKVVQLHGGVIFAAAELNRGATFTVILPFKH